MEKRVFSAFLISMVIIVGWTVLTPKTQHVVNKDVTVDDRAASLPVSAPASTSVSSTSFSAQAKIPEIPVDIAEPEASFEVDGMEVFYGENTAAIKKVFFKKFNHTFYFNNGLQLAGVDFNKVNVRDGVLIASGSDKEKEIEFAIDLRNYNGINSLNIRIKNLTSHQITLPVKLILTRSNLAEKNFNMKFYQAVAAFANGTIRPDLKKDYLSDQNINFAAFCDKYTCIIIEPKTESTKAFLEKSDTHKSNFGLLVPDIKINEQASKELFFYIYLGPENLDQIGHLNPRWKEVVYFGFFDPIVKFLLKILEIFYFVTRNWGLAIILLSGAIFCFSFPLTLKQMKSMKEMQALQPKIEKLRELHKNNPQKLNKEVLELYKEHKINPLGGCLPLLLQMPIFLALYQVLMRSVELKNAGFLWIKDLSEPDRLVQLSQPIPFIGNDINILPILMAIVMFFQQKMNTAASVGQSAEQQKMMAVIFPIMFGFIFYGMPSGLVLYWFLNSLLMTVFQLRMVRNG